VAISSWCIEAEAGLKFLKAPFEFFRGRSSTELQTQLRLPYVRKIAVGPRQPHSILV
jgi:hypothetical protein